MKTKLTLIGLVTTVLITSLTNAATFDTNAFGNSLGGWKKKKNTAAEYKSADSNYRTYKPTVSPTPDGGVFVSTKIDHIRGWGGDDHCQLNMTFDKDGKIVSSSAEIKMGDKSFNTQIVTASAALAGASGGTTAVIALGAEVAKKLQDQISKWNEGGGRANFPAVVTHNFNLIASSVRK